MMAMINTERCILEILKEADFEGLSKLYSDEIARQYLGGIIVGESFAQKFDAMLFDKQAVHFVVRLQKDGQFIGLISLDEHHEREYIELSYQFLSTEHCKGYAIECMPLILDYAKDKMKLSALISETQIANKPSIKLLQKLGFSKYKRVERFECVQEIFKLDF